MNVEEVVEAMARSAHDCWFAAYKAHGIESRRAHWGEEFMVPYEALSERGREFDRVIMRAILAAFAGQGFEVVPRMCEACKRGRHDACGAQVGSSGIKCRCAVCWGKERA